MKNNFIDWLLWSVERVGEGYFGHSERVYCYELYHLMRAKMHMHEENEPGSLDEVFLHSEPVKVVLNSEKAEHLEVWPLRMRRMPDFILHSPGDFNHQIATMEVKVVRLSYEALVDDLLKLTEMIGSYKYQLGVFLCINNSMGLIVEHIRTIIESQVQINDDIQIVIKPSFHEDIIIKSVGELIAELNEEDSVEPSH
ncbi:hypothetical protein SSARUM2_002120 [Serratia sp. K-E0102]|uniref:hypothetical protein n=1 Tax=Serratia TaxID=613 RepID=UPI00076020CD|nr:MULTISPECIES: hypothetical protein [Serratia]WGZ69703.1 hypothetical protein SSARUM2_002120 [Serratia sp. K-E0102]